jgi:periplasmic divalent cation tolerance protein
MSTSDPVHLERSVVQIVTATATLDAARAIAQSLLTQRLVACIQIDGPIESHYCWQGKQEQSTEYRLTIKTAGHCKSPVMQAVQKLHSYDVPEVLATSISSANESYLDWVYQQTSRMMISFAIYLYGPQWGPLGVPLNRWLTDLARLNGCILNGTVHLCGPGNRTV